MQEDGSYAGFDEQELTSQSGGKARAARLIKVPYTLEAVLSKTSAGSYLSTMPVNSKWQLDALTRAPPYLSHLMWCACMTLEGTCSFHVQEKHGFKYLVMVGDGATDLEARQPGGADIFIGYGGVVERPSIAGKADWYIYKIRDLLEALA